MSDEGQVWRRKRPPPGPGIFRVFWPAFLGWGSAAAPKAMAAASWYLHWSFPALAWELVEPLKLIGLAIAAFGALWVTSRYEEAKSTLAKTLNFSVILAVLSTLIVVV